MEYVAPALELIKNGSPFVAGAAFMFVLFRIHLAEVNRNWAAQVALWDARYKEKVEDCRSVSEKANEYLHNWINAEQTVRSVKQTVHNAAQEVGQ